MDTMKRQFLFSAVLAASATVHAQGVDTTIAVSTNYSSMLCYGNGLDTVIAYHNTGGLLPLVLRFCSGQVDSLGDYIQIYDGVDQLAPLIYVGNGTNGDLTSVYMISTNPDNALTLQIQSNDTLSCMSQGYELLKWAVEPDSPNLPQCIFAGVPSITQASAIRIHPDPAGDHMTIDLGQGHGIERQVHIIDAVGREVIALVFAAAEESRTIDVTGLAPGSYCAVAGGGIRQSSARFLVMR